MSRLNPRTSGTSGARRSANALHDANRTGPIERLAKWLFGSAATLVPRAQLKRLPEDNQTSRESDHGIYSVTRSYAASAPRFAVSSFSAWRLTGTSAYYRHRYIAVNWDIQSILISPAARWTL